MDWMKIIYVIIAIALAVGIEKGLYHLMYKATRDALKDHFDNQD